MKRHLILPVVTALLGAANAQAAVIYSQSFSDTSTADLHGTTVEGGTESANWVANTNFNRDGMATNANGSAALPFTPVSGMVYTVSATVNSGANWGALGFASSSGDFRASIDPRFTGSSISGVPWMLHRDIGQQAFAGPSTANQVAGTVVAAATVNLLVQLDTTVDQAWKASFFVNGTQYGTTFTYGTTNPTINAVGLSKTTGGTASDFSNFVVTAVPEPSAALLGGLGALGLLRRRRRA